MEREGRGAQWGVRPARSQAHSTGSGTWMARFPVKPVNTVPLPFDLCSSLRKTAKHRFMCVRQLTSLTFDASSVTTNCSSLLLYPVLDPVCYVVPMFPQLASSSLGIRTYREPNGMSARGKLSLGEYLEDTCFFIIII